MGYDFSKEVKLKDFGRQHSCLNCQTTLCGFRCIYRDCHEEYLCRIVQKEYEEANK